jgi:hypothetical protein
VIHRVGVVLIALSVGACSRGDARNRDGVTEASSTAPAGESRRASPPVIAKQTQAYEPVQLGAVGRIHGVVELASDAPPDSTVHPTRDGNVCGQNLSVRTVQGQGKGLGDVVVWLSDIRRGRALPLGRRGELELDHCQLTPRIVTVLAGGTLNLRSSDAMDVRLQIGSQSTGETLETVPFNDYGQIVPVSKPLTDVGQLIVSSDTHPWARAYVNVFDHPYFALTPLAGTFTLDSVPPGRYHLVAWHERYGRVEQEVVVEAGKDASVVMTMK